MPEVSILQQLVIKVDTGVNIEDAVQHSFTAGVIRQGLLALSGDVVGRCVEGVQRARSETEMLRNHMLERSMLILSSVSLALVAPGCCPGIPRKEVDLEMIGL